MTIKLKDLVDTKDKNYCHECGVIHKSDYIYLQYHK